LTVSCVLRGHGHRYEVQVVVQVFFPGARFCFREHVSEAEGSLEGGYCVESFFDGENAACAVVYKDGAEIARKRFDADEFNNAARSVDVGKNPKSNFLNPRRVLMLAVYHALQTAVGAYTPWGALTGVRPSKPVREWMRDGCDDAEILERLGDPFCVNGDKARLAVAVAHAERRVEARIRGTVGVYVGVPFCPSRCVYCSFNSTDAVASEDVLDAYISAIIAEARQVRIGGCGRNGRSLEVGARISSIYIGGGTPTFLPEKLLEKMLFAMRENFALLPDAEFTVEAGRPDTLTAAKLKILRKYGVNRIAVNPQTLNDSTLAAIGRGHTAADFFRAFALARDAGFDCINTDLIAGLPGETADDMRRNMDALAALAPENITIHTLAIKRASRLHELRHTPNSAHSHEAGSRFPPHEKNESASDTRRLDFHRAENTIRQSRDFLAQTHQKNARQNAQHPAYTADIHPVEAALSAAATACAAMGLSPYYLYRQKNMVGLFENVGYALPGRECLYNVGMMAEMQTILGIGAGAGSKYITESGFESGCESGFESEFERTQTPDKCANGVKIRREFNAKNPEIYIERIDS